MEFSASGLSPKPLLTTAGSWDVQMGMCQFSLHVFLLQLICKFCKHKKISVVQKLFFKYYFCKMFVDLKSRMTRGCRKKERKQQWSSTPGFCPQTRGTALTRSVCVGRPRLAQSHSLQAFGEFGSITANWDFSLPLSCLSNKHINKKFLKEI